jgi:uncharacterized phage protein (TIGR01671 family)
MEDRFKFRAWWKPNYREPIMLYDVEKTYDFMRGEPESICADCFGEVLEDKDYIVMQCTGMKDKNGKLIYEGDFLKDDENLLYEVIFKLQEYATSFSLKRREIPDYYPHITTWCGLGYRNCNKYEVVGNIYENEELIDESKK